MADGGADLKQTRAPAQHGKTVCVVMRAEVRTGCDEAFEGLMSDFVHTVRTEERGCVSYALTRQMGSPLHFAVHARFATWRAFQRHAITEHMTRALPRLTALLATPVALEIFLEV